MNPEDFKTDRESIAQFVDQRIKVQTMLLINAEIEGLKARRKVAKGYTFNTSMNIECELLTAQIKGLENFRNTRI